ncbi:MAG: ACT domain-containing protein [Arhodomonas sp.]|nr:ACT domain-containing protein [Arhodomonas sp.]
MSDVVLINISGQDKPGITYALMDILAGYGARVLDIGQAVIHDTLALGMLIRIPEESRNAPVLKDLLFEAHKLELQVRFTPIEAGDYDQWVAHGERRATCSPCSGGG